jgi:SecD/SecF fusion protein
MIQMDLGQKVSISEVQKTIKKYNLNPDIVYSGNDKHEVIIKTTKALNADARDEVQKTIEKAYNLKGSSVIASEEFGPTMGKEIKNNALKSILLASLGMLLYIIVRFRSWKYGVAAIAGILHDVLVMIAVYAIFGITVNNPFIAAILTVVGYSINDTIVIFDRVRENSHIIRGKPIMEILDRSINQTLDRSIMTSVTTLISIVPLLIMVSTQLAQFVLPLMVGVATGTYSSICLCSPLYYEFNKKSEASKYMQQQKAKKRIEAKKAEKKGKDLEPKQVEAPVEVLDAEVTENTQAQKVKAAPTSKGNGASKSKKNKKKKGKHK